MMTLPWRFPALAIITFWLTPSWAEPPPGASAAGEPPERTSWGQVGQRSAVVEPHDASSGLLETQTALQQLVVLPSGRIVDSSWVQDGSGEASVRRDTSAFPLEAIAKRNNALVVVDSAAQAIQEELPSSAPEYGGGKQSVIEESQAGRFAASLAQEGSASAVHLKLGRASSLPPWQLMLIGSVASAILIVTTMTCTNILTSPWPWKLSEVQRMESELEAANEKARILREFLEAKRAKEASQASADALLALPDASAGPVGPAQGLEGEMLARTQEIDKTIGAAYHQVANQAIPMIARADVAVNTFTKGINTIHKSVEELAKEEAWRTMGKMQTQLGMEQRAIPAWLYSPGHGTDPPPFTELVAAFLAPAQLAMIQAQQNAYLFLNILFLGAAAVVCVIDIKNSCQDPKVWTWMSGFIAINVLEMICRSVVIYHTRHARHKLRDQESRRQNESTGNAVWDTFNVLQNNSGQFFFALHAHLKIVGSGAVTLLNWLCIMAIVWGGFGLWVSIEDIVEDSTTCDSHTVVSFMHAYSFCFTMMLVVKIISVALWLLQLFSGFDFVQAPLLNAAKSVDDEIPFRLPVVATIIRSLFLSTQGVHTNAFESHSEFLKEQNLGLEKDRIKLLKDAQDCEERIAKYKRQAELIDDQRRRAAAVEQETVDEFQVQAREADAALLAVGRSEGASMPSASAASQEDPGKGGGKGR